MKHKLISIPKFTNSGLGNLLFPMCKAFLASEALNAELRIPIQYDIKRKQNYFNPRQFGYRYFIISRKKKIKFTNKDYLAIRKITNTDDYFCNIKTYVVQNNIKDGVIINEGMWGGFHSIAKAKNWVKSFLHNDKYSRLNFAEIGALLKPDKLHIAFHVRRGDFLSASIKNFKNKNRSVFNTQIPTEWFMNVASFLKANFNDQVQFLLFTDDKENSDILDFIRKFKPITSFSQKNSINSDLALMGNVDLLVCSNSSFSMWAAFISTNYYLFYAPFLIEDNDGLYYLWKEEIYEHNDNLHHSNYEKRGYICHEDGVISKILLTKLNKLLNRKLARFVELVYGGKTSKD